MCLGGARKAVDEEKIKRRFTIPMGEFFLLKKCAYLDIEQVGR